MERDLRGLEAWLAERRPAYRRSLRPGANDAAIEACESAIGHALPESLRALYRWHDGQAKGCLEGLDRFGMFQPLGEVERTIREMNELAESGDFPHEMWWNAAWFPFLWSGGGDYLCVDLSGCFGGPSGQVLQLVGDEPERIIWFPDVEAWLNILVEGLRSGLLVEAGGDVDLADPEAYEPAITARFPGYPRTVALE